MLMHYVLFKFKPGALDEAMRQRFETAYTQLEQALDSVVRATVRHNCVDREQNVDMMVEMELTSTDALPEYLGHPIHVELGAQTRQHLETVFSFDYMI